jgi:hypothetical protein
MDIAAPGLNIRLQIGDAIDDGHDKSQAGVGCLCFSVSSMGLRSAQYFRLKLKTVQR